jgi:protein-glutamine gamma-glutamyltransferase
VNTPPLLLGAALLFWGWQTGHFWWGALAGGLLESSRLVRARWSLTQADFNRLWNVCVVLFLGVGTFLLINEGTISFNDFFANAGRRPEAIKQAGRSALTWFQWFPLIFFPFMIAQAFNDQPRVGLATFSWWLRKHEAQNPNSTLPRETVDISFGYLALCLLGASATTQRVQSFYFGVLLLIAWALLATRTKHRSLVAWCTLFAVVASAGYGGHIGLFRLQKKLEEMNVSWFTRLAALGYNDRESRTRLGTIGKLKNSDRIVLRLRTDGGAPPELLRETSFNRYGRGTWTVLKHDYVDVPSEGEGGWKFLPRKVSRRQVTIAGYFRRGEGLLPLPTGCSEIADLAVGNILTNRFGAAKMKDGPGMAMFDARYDHGATFDSGVAAEDERTFEENEPAVAQVAQELQLDPGLPAEEAMRRVAKYFADHFQYASYLTPAHAATTNETELARFLLHTRSGHCEYFASATTLLLRHAGVPTRYAVGYSVQEGRGKKYLVRDRHAHAWTIVWDGKNWIDFDTTPASWNAAEAAHSSWFQPVKDFFSDLWFQFSKFRWGKTEWRKWFMLAPVPLLIIVLVRFVFGKQWKRMRARRAQAEAVGPRAGLDSEFYRIEKHFAARGLERGPSETWSEWLRRLEQHEVAAAQLHRVLALHQRHRFDPSGLTANEREELRATVTRWLSQRAAG